MGVMRGGITIMADAKTCYRKEMGESRPSGAKIADDEDMLMIKLPFNDDADMRSVLARLSEAWERRRSFFENGCASMQLGLTTKPTVDNLCESRRENAE